MGGYAKVGNDLDNLLEPWQAGDGYAAATGYAINGADLNQRYAPASVGAGYTGGTGYNDNGGDIGPRFCAKGQRNSGLPINGGNYVGRSSGLINSAMEANIAIQINANGSYSVACVGNSPDTTSGSTGTWLPAGQAASDYQVEFVWAQSSQYLSGPATVTNGAATYQACTTTRQIGLDAQVPQTS